MRGHPGAACGQLALTSTTVAQKIYEESAGGSNGKTAGATVRDIEDLALGQQSSKNAKPLADRDRAVAQPGGAAAVDRWRKRDVSTKHNGEGEQGGGGRAPVSKWSGLGNAATCSASTAAGSAVQPQENTPEEDESRSDTAVGWTPPDGLLNQAEVRQLIQQLSASTAPGGLAELSNEQLRNAMIEMDPEGEGVRVGVSSFAAWWEQQQHQQRQHGSDVGEGALAGCCWLGGWEFHGSGVAVAGFSVALACVVAGLGISRARQLQTLSR